MAISVLVVDDDIAALAFARRVLSAAGYAVSEASNGGEALQQIMANSPDVLITDILMPDGDGIELIAAVKRAHPTMRVIAVTERRFLGALDLLDLANKLGADATLEKPLVSDRLLATIASLAGSEAQLAQPTDQGDPARRAKSATTSKLLTARSSIVTRTPTNSW